MSALHPVQRGKTARAVADALGISTRSVQRIAAEPRAEYEARARARGDQILAWREEGLLWREIADRLNITPNAALKAGIKSKKRQEAEAAKAEAQALQDSGLMPPPLF